VFAVSGLARGGTLADRDCIVIVDHGSHRAESNRRHEDFVAELKP
jgi:hypothetical protein